MPTVRVHVLDTTVAEVDAEGCVEVRPVPERWATHPDVELTAGPTYECQLGPVQTKEVKTPGREKPSRGPRYRLALRGRAPGRTELRLIVDGRNAPANGLDPSRTPTSATIIHAVPITTLAPPGGGGLTAAPSVTSAAARVAAAAAATQLISARGHEIARGHEMPTPPLVVEGAALVNGELRLEVGQATVLRARLREPPPDGVGDLELYAEEVLKKAADKKLVNVAPFESQPVDTDNPGAWAEWLELHIAPSDGADKRMREEGKSSIRARLRLQLHIGEEGKSVPGASVVVPILILPASGASTSAATALWAHHAEGRVARDRVPRRAAHQGGARGAA